MNKEKVKENIENTFYSIISIGKVLKNSKFFNDIKELKGSTNECVILGNGPSLRDSIKNDLKYFLENKKIFCVNAFAVSKEFVELKPDYYLFADPGWWVEKPRDTVKKIREDVFNALIDKTNWQMTIFIPFEAKDNLLLNDLILKNKNLKLKFYNKVSVMGFPFIRNFFYKHNLGIPRAQNVLIPTLILALNLGFKKIYLFGADHSWHENLVLTEQNVLCFKDVHFYNENEVLELIPIKNNITKKTFTVHEEFYSLYITLKIYFFIKEYAKTKNAVILNASSKTYIDAFDRLDIKSIVHNNNPKK